MRRGTAVPFSIPHLRAVCKGRLPVQNTICIKVFVGHRRAACLDGDLKSTYKKQSLILRYSPFSFLKNIVSSSEFSCENFFHAETFFFRDPVLPGTFVRHNGSLPARRQQKSRCFRKKHLLWKDSFCGVRGCAAQNGGPYCPADHFPEEPVFSRRFSALMMYRVLSLKCLLSSSLGGGQISGGSMGTGSMASRPFWSIA